MQHIKGSDYSEDVGYLLKKQRTKNNLSIRSLAVKAGVSPAIISRIEQGHTSPSFITLKKILDPLKLNFAAFFSMEKSETDNPVIKKKNMKKIHGIGKNMEMVLISSEKPGKIQMFIEKYYPGGNSGDEMLIHDSTETGICIKGKLKLELAGKTYFISEGDGWLFDSKLPHKFSNPGNKKAILISSNTPPVF
ncbi:MAG: cupin domain-containing protein [Elusimicrobia bacterium]|nr:cupin domain-containing protein [Elusimicrobiota bacterium]